MEAQELKNRYQKGERDFSHAQLSGINLCGADLRDVNLIGANLTEANLAWAKLDNAQLEGVCLHQARCNHASLTRANLCQAQLSRTQLIKVDLRFANLERGNLNWAILQNTNLTSANLQSASLKQANLESAKLEGAELMGAQLVGANLARASLIGANLSWANLHEACLEDANLRQAVLVGANLTETNLNFSSLRRANLTEADLHQAFAANADLSEANLKGADLSRANFSGAYLLKASLHQAHLFRATLQDVYCLHANLSDANLRGANLRRGDFSGSYFKDTILAEANLTSASLLKSHLIRTNLDGAKLTGCCIASWHLEDVDLSKVVCRYVFTDFNYHNKRPTERYPIERDLQPGELAAQPTKQSQLIFTINFSQKLNWEALVFTIAQLKGQDPRLGLKIIAYKAEPEAGRVKLKVNYSVNTQLLSQRILALYVQMEEQVASQRNLILQLLEINQQQDVDLGLKPASPTVTSPVMSDYERKQKMYRQVSNQIQHIIKFQSFNQVLEGVERLLFFLQQQGFSTQHIQNQVLARALWQRSQADATFRRQLWQWYYQNQEVGGLSSLQGVVHSVITKQGV